MKPNNSINCLIKFNSKSKSEVAAFKIVRGDRATNKSIVAKGILRNVGEYKREKTNFYY